MSFKCNLGFHSWNGCKCKACDKTRDESHDWAADCEKCAKCGKTRSVGHSWSGCKCTMCGKTRDEVNVENSERVSSIQDPSPLTSSPTQRMREATCSHKWNKSGVQCSLCERKRNLTGMTVVAAAYSLVAPLDTASELDRSFLCISPSSYHPDAYDGVWLMDETKGTTGSFVIEKVLDHQYSTSPKAQELFQQGCNFREEGKLVMAAYYTRQAADMDHAEAQFNYALMCLRGDGVPLSEWEGLRWMKKSADNGFEPAKRNCDILRRFGHM